MPFVSCSKFNTSQAAQDAAIALKQNALNDCTGNPLAGTVPTCAQMTTAISDAVAGVSTAPTGAAGGDLQGTYPNPTIKDQAIVDAVTGSTAVQTAVAGVFNRCDGTDMPAGANLIECSAKGTDIPYLVSGVIPATQLPSYVDDVLEFPALAGFPATGEAGKIYIEASTSKTYRWNGTGYTEISASAGITVQDEGSVLTTAATSLNFVGTGVQATSSGGAVTVTVPGVVPTIPVTGTVPPTAPPASGASHWYYDSVLDESWLWNGQGWKLIQGHAIDTPGNLGPIPLGSALLIYRYVVPRNAKISLSGQAFMNFVTEPTDPIYVQTNLALYRNGTSLAIQSTHADGQYGAGDGFQSSVAYAVGVFAAGDVIELRMNVTSLQVGLVVAVSAASFQAMFEG